MATNRRQALAERTDLVGIDFVEVEPTTQSELWVHFLGLPADEFATVGEFTAPGTVQIASLSAASSRPVVPIASADWTTRRGLTVLHVVVDGPGDFSRYALTLIDSETPSRVDPYFNGVPFRFQAGCRTGLDCQPAETECAPEREPEVAIDYRARDFESFRRVLFEFASQRWPAWSDRLEADAGVMLTDLMSALGDEMSYYQDRVARESTLRTATQRRSLRHHARLLDYEPHDGLTAWTWLQFTASAVDDLPAGTEVRTRSRDPHTGVAVAEPVRFQVGLGLSDSRAFEIRPNWNEIDAWIWDEDDTCLPAGATAVTLDGDWVGNAEPLWTGVDRWVALRTTPDDAAIPARAHVARVVDALVQWDPLAGQAVTRLEFAAEDATPWALDLTVLTVHGNVVPAVAGRTIPAAGEPDLLFLVRNPSNPDAPPGWSFRPPEAVERTGPNGTICYLLPLLETEHEPLSFLGESPPAAVPEVTVEAMSAQGEVDPPQWLWRRSLLGSPASQSGDAHFTLEDGLWDEVARYPRAGAEPVRHVDYRTGGGFSVRFGDGSIGQRPSPDLVMRVRYRVGAGRDANLGAHTLVECDVAGVEVTNPLAIGSGVDPETPREIRQLAPEAWRHVAYRAVRPEDYAEALERLLWVQRAGSQLRWTGSWLTLFGTPDPRDAVTLTAAQRGEAEAQLDRVRQAGREAHVCDPVYAWLDLRIAVCVEPAAYRADVQRAVTRALLAEGGVFDPDQLTFGEPLRRSKLCAAIAAVPGVRAVEQIRVRRRGHFDWRAFEEDTLEVGVYEVLGVANDPLFPERGSLQLIMEGGA